MDENFSVNLLISRSGKQKNRFESSLLSLLLKRDKPIFFVVLFHQILQMRLYLKVRWLLSTSPPFPQD